MGKRKAAKAGLTNPPLQKKLFDGDPTKHLAPTSTPYGAVEVQIRTALAGKASQHETAPLQTSDVVSLDVGGTVKNVFTFCPQNFFCPLHRGIG